MNNQPELEIDEDGNKYWHINRLYYHREDGPAIEYTNGGKHWYFNGKEHRIDGPAVIYADGDKYWYLNGMCYSYEEWFKRLTPEQQYNYLWSLDE
jgi:hypothetical protein